MNLLKGIFSHMLNICKKMGKVELRAMIAPIMHIHYLNLKKQPNQNDDLPKKKSAASFKHILDKELAKRVKATIDIYM